MKATDKGGPLVARGSRRGSDCSTCDARNMLRPCDRVSRVGLGAWREGGEVSQASREHVACGHAFGFVCLLH